MREKWSTRGRITSHLCSSERSSSGLGGSASSELRHGVTFNLARDTDTAFSGGSALNATMRSMVAAFNTNTAAGFGCLGWVLVDMIRYKGKFSLIGACEGVIAGLVGITPAAGYVSPWMAGLIGFLTGAIVACFKKVNEWLRIDDGLEVFKLHGIGGIVGSFLTGIFAQSWVSALDGATLAPGGIDGVGVQVGKQVSRTSRSDLAHAATDSSIQLAEICAIGAWSFTVTCILLLPFKYIPFLKLRISEEKEREGLDRHQFIEGEQIGDWSFFEETRVTHGVPTACRVIVSKGWKSR